jgi:hypothetical protein
MPQDILSGGLSSILSLISAAAGLGTAAMGLVDASKAFAGGPSNIGFGCVEEALGPFLIARDGAGGSGFGKTEILRTLKSNWINGVAKADQKAKAKSLIHLELTPDNAERLAAASGVDAATLHSLAEKVAAGTAPAQAEINALGQFDAILSAVLDAAYERGDQKYRNACKLLGFVVAIVLAEIAGGLLYGTWRGVGISFLVGASATPLAPVAKDLTTALQAAATAVSLAKR